MGVVGGGCGPLPDLAVARLPVLLPFLATRMLRWTVLGLAEVAGPGVLLAVVLVTAALLPVALLLMLSLPEVGAFSVLGVVKAVDA